MDYKEFTGKSYEEALKKAMDFYDIDDKEQLDIEMLEEGSKGFLGIGAKDTIISVAYHPKFEQKIVDFVNSILETLDINGIVSIEYPEKNILKVNIEGEECAILIGRRGESMKALQTILASVMSTDQDPENYKKIIVDIENYREKRENSLTKFANKVANKVIDKKRDIKLEPMTPYERMVVHTALQGVENITTYSEGKEPYRRVVVSYEESREEF